MFKSKSSCLASIASVKKNAPIAAIEDQTVEGFKKEKNPKFVIYTDKSGAPRFKLQAKNGQNILACGEPFSDVKAVKNSIKSVIRNIESPIVEKDK